MKTMVVFLACILASLSAQADLLLLRARGVDIPVEIVSQADRLGGLIYGLLRAEDRSR